MNVFKRFFSRTVVYFFNLFPLKTNKIFLFSYYGSQYNDNPKYISEYIKKNDLTDQFDVVWAFNNLDSMQHISGIRKVRTMSLRYFYELCTSKVVITNYRTTDLFIKRKNQHYIQTWHSSMRLKQIEKDAENSLTLQYIEMAKKDSLKCDLLISGSKYSTEIFKRSFWYSGKIFEFGTPRNDVLVHSQSELTEKIRSLLNLQKNSKIVLYAPTFRKDHSFEAYNLEFQKVIDTLEAKSGECWVVLVKLHPHLVSQSNRLKFSHNVIDVSTFDDTQELLSIADILITDYSSLMFDYSITRKPCFLYVPDAAEYIKNDRKLYFDLEELPFIMATSNDELLEKIQSFNKRDYEIDLNSFLKRVGSFEEGMACKELLRHIKKVCFGQDKRRALNEAV